MPLAQIKQHPHGHLFPDPQPLAAPKDADWPYRLELAHPAMLEQLSQLDSDLHQASLGNVTIDPPSPGTGGDVDQRHGLCVTDAHRNRTVIELLLVSRREHAVYNSVGAATCPALRRRRPFNPAYLNPADAQRIGVADGATIQIESASGSMQRGACSARRTCARASCRWPTASTSTDEEGRGASTAALIDDAHDYEPISGLPRMSAIPVTVRRAGRGLALELVATQLDAGLFAVPGVGGDALVAEHDLARLVGFGLRDLGRRRARSAAP